MWRLKKKNKNFFLVSKHINNIDANNEKSPYSVKVLEGDFSHSK